MKNEDVKIYVDVADSAAPIIAVKFSNSYYKCIIDKIDASWTNEQSESWSEKERTEIALMVLLDGKKADVLKALYFLKKANIYELSKKLRASYSVIHKAVNELQKLKIVSTKFLRKGNRSATIVELLAEILPASKYIQFEKLSRWDAYRTEVEKDYQKALKDEEDYKDKLFKK